MKLYRCCRCNLPAGLQFAFDGPKWPSCGSESNRVIVPMEYTHWFEPCEDGPLYYRGSEGRFRVACMPQLATLQLAKPLIVTGRLQAVTCPKCVAVDGFKTALLKKAEKLGLTEEEFYDAYPETRAGLILGR